MRKFTRVIAGLALGTAAAGGAIAMGATAASAGTDNGLGTFALSSPPMMNNTFIPFGDFGNNNNNCGNNLGNGNGCWNNNNNNNMFWNNQSFWNQSAFTDNVDDDSSFAVIGKDAAIAFQDSTKRNSNFFNSGWWQNNNWWNNNNNNCWNNNLGNGF
ncbi:hypothetical protein [Microbispora amethystogenes]|uniref:Uncharacterized protein n=1 Tax=Microbispora amethystogenes TaxID=1427754 RepID=A0ABQ4FH09_9ACTN|nr:hypothetical protein [Microbispora amethystogenes]GIH34038.1 hypothetical protein Mam01_42020 [Microbispora amethystogenes]